MMSFVHDYNQMSADELRSEVINVLKEAYADGRITVDAFERSLKKATNAETKEDMIGLLSDIPASKAKDSRRPAAAASAAEDNAKRGLVYESGGFPGKPDTVRGTGRLGTHRPMAAGEAH